MSTERKDKLDDLFPSLVVSNATDILPLMISPTKALLDGQVLPQKAAKPRRTQAERRASAETNLLTAAARLIAIRGLANVY